MSRAEPKFAIWVRGADDFRRDESEVLCGALSRVYGTRVVSDYRWTSKRGTLPQERAEAFLVYAPITKVQAERIAATLNVFFSHQRGVLELNSAHRSYASGVEVAVLDATSEPEWFRIRS